MVLNMADFGKSKEIAPNSLKCLLNPSKWISNPLQDTVCIDFGWIRECRILADLWAKSLGYSPCFRTWWILISPGNRSKLPESPAYMLGNGFITPCGTVCVDFGWIREGRILAVFEQKPWAIAHGFEHGGFWQVQEIASNSLKSLLNPSKWISNPLRDRLCRFRVNSRVSDIGRLWAKSLGYSPWFRTWRILVSPGNRSKLPESPATCLEMDL